MQIRHFGAMAARFAVAGTLVAGLVSSRNTNCMRVSGLKSLLKI
jgi:hypothetical protein